MTVFAVIAPEKSPLLQKAIGDNFPGSFFEFSDGQFVISTDGMTAAQVAQKLGANGEVGRFVIFSVASHWGFHRKDLWEWLTANAS